MRIIIAGSRTFCNKNLLFEKMDKITKKLTKVIVLSGTAKGADTLGEEWAFSRWHTVERYQADWTKHGKSAGPIRNREMLDALGEKGCVVCFWDGKSPGTKDLITEAKKRGIKTKVFLFEDKK